MKWSSVFLSVLGSSGALSQTLAPTTSLPATGTARQTISSFLSSGTAVPTGQACAAVSSILSEQVEAPYVVRADLAYACARSAPIVKADALRLIDGIVAALSFQSNVGHLAKPPAEYPLAGVDLLGEIKDLRDQVDSDEFTSEIDFEANFTAILGRAQDGHLAFQFDGLSVFAWSRLFGSLVSVSSDGTSEPEIFFLEDLQAAQLGGAPASAISEINGQSATEFLQIRAQNVSYGGFQDPDALYNAMFANRNSGSPGRASQGSFVVDTVYIGAETTVTFANGSTITQQNVAIYNSPYSWTGLTSGEAFYELYCSAQAKASAYGIDLDDLDTLTGLRIDPVQKKQMIHQKRQQPQKRELKERQATSVTRPATETFSSVVQTATAISGYPDPVVLSDDLSLSGYFLEEAGFEDTAVLVLQSMSEADPEGFQSSLTSFLNQCRSQNKRHLVLDLQGNPGGTISLGYEVFAQLFPNILPYGTGTLAAHEGLDVLGQYYTNFSRRLIEEYPDDVNILAANNYYSQYTATSYENSSGELFQSWDQLYGPVKTDEDEFTNLIRWDLDNTNFNLASGGIVITGYGNNTNVQPAPFDPQNIIILADGRCSSTCTILSHFLKWQGKVKSVAMGGRPSVGAMQAVGGTKGSQVYQYQLLASDVYYAADGASTALVENSPTLGPILNDSAYIVLRGANAGSAPDSLSDFQFNWQNNVAEGDDTYLPLQFKYEAADCHMYYTADHWTDISTLWSRVAAEAFGLNDTEIFSGCVAGSTNAPSSLSGDSALYNNGVPTNVTEFLPEQQGGGSDENAAGRIGTSLMASVVVVAATFFAI